MAFGQASRTMFQPTVPLKVHIASFLPFSLPPFLHPFLPSSIPSFLFRISKFWILFLDIFNYVSNMFALSTFSKFKIKTVPEV